MARASLGRIFQRGGVWWIQYSHLAQQYRESSKSIVKDDAKKLLQIRLGEIGRGALRGTIGEVTTFDDLVTILEQDWQVHARKSNIDPMLVRLRKYFIKCSANDITYDRIQALMLKRLAEGYAPASVRKEIAILGRILTLAVRSGKIATRPPLPTLMVRNTREGFFEDEQIRAVISHLPQGIDDFVLFAYITGWRRSEIRSLEWKNVDMVAGSVRLAPGTTKNDDGRFFPFSANRELAALMSRRLEFTRAWQVEMGVILRPLFLNPDGSPVLGFRKPWVRACKLAGCPERVLHDLRRTAVRNLERNGISRSVAMQITGHKTEAVFRRYAIVNEHDITEAVAKISAANDANASKAVNDTVVIPMGPKQ